MKLSENNIPLRRRSLLYFIGGLLLLSLLTAAWFRIQPSLRFQQKAIEKYIHEQQKDAESLLKDTALLRRLVLNQESAAEFEQVFHKRYGFFLIAETISEDQDILFWNNQKIVPPQADFSLEDGTYFRQLANGHYILLKRTHRFAGMSNNILSYVLIPVLHKFYLESDYLQTRFEHDENAIRQVAISNQPTAHPVKSLRGKTLFYLRRVAHAQTASMDAVTVILRSIALLLILILVQLQAERVLRRRGMARGLLHFTAAVFIVRTILYLFPGLFGWPQYSLFDPSVYASNWLNRSLGDLLLNAIFAAWIVIFTWTALRKKLDLSALAGRRAYAAGGAAVFLLILISFQVASVVHSLVTDSRISFNVSDFFSLNIFTVFGLIALAIISLAYYYASRLLLQITFQLIRPPVFVYFGIALIGLLFLSVRGGPDLVLFELPILLWLLIYTFVLSQQQYVVNRLRFTIAGFLFWTFVFSVSLSLLIMQGNRETEVRKRKAIAEKLHQVSDPSSERTISIALAYLDNRFLKNNFHRFQNPEAGSKLRDSIINEGFRGYYRYETQIYVFDQNNNPVNNADDRRFSELNTIVTSQSRPTPIPGLYFHEMSYDRFAYIARRTIGDSARFLGTFFLVAVPKQYKSADAFYPELFRQVNQSDVENSPIYAYAIYDKGLLINSSAKYPFSITLTRDELPSGEFERREKGEYDELWYKASRSKTIVVAKKQDRGIEGITLFSYLFCAFLFMVGLLQLLSVVLEYLRTRGKPQLFTRIDIRTQIHGIIILVSIFSFIVIGVATISFFIQRYKRNNIERLSRTASITVKEIQQKLQDENLFNPDSDIYDPVSNAALEELTKEIAEIHNVDVNIYDLEGTLQVTSDEDVYRRGILSYKMHPVAFYHLSNLREVQWVQEETISRLNYLSIYTAIRGDDGRVYAYLNIPYFSSQIDLKQEISNFLVTIINLNAFIFLIAGLVALFITNKITASFSLISQRMREIRLGGKNQTIEWTRDDEIGALVKQYNAMVGQLEHSAEALAKSEREGAWREMARQVAHEIKNPLTPMKLSIQYLQKALQNKQANVSELTSSVTQTLIEQIEHLSKIAADFSQFANIGNRRLEQVHLHSILTSLADLYGANPRVTIQMETDIDDVYLNADKTQMNRLFTNLLANAVEACPREETCEIRISGEKQDGKVLVGISDNGSGIPVEMRANIFAPNFTTKSSGTGLGLAMCKGIVEQAGGMIWFSTEEGVGTTFYVQLPVKTS